MIAGAPAAGKGTQCIGIVEKVALFMTAYVLLSAAKAAFNDSLLEDERK